MSTLHRSDQTQTSGLLDDPSAHTLVAGALEAVFLPAHGMLGASLRHRGVEILRRVEDLEAAAARGSSAGIPLLHPWANRRASYDGSLSAGAYSCGLRPHDERQGTVSRRSHNYRAFDRDGNLVDVLLSEKRS